MKSPVSFLKHPRLKLHACCEKGWGFRAIVYNLSLVRDKRFKTSFPIMTKHRSTQLISSTVTTIPLGGGFLMAKFLTSSSPSYSRLNLPSPKKIRRLATAVRLIGFWSLGTQVLFKNWRASQMLQNFANTWRTDYLLV